MIQNLKKNLALFTGLITFSLCTAQVNTGNLQLKGDSATNAKFINSLNGFLVQADKPASENEFVSPAYFIETALLLDEIKDISKSEENKDDHFFKPYLLNLAKVNDTDYLVQISFMGMNSNKPQLRAIFTMFASPKNDRFYFRSPLKQNTKSWPHKDFGNTRVYYETILNEANAKKYFDKIKEFDTRLNAPDMPSEFYCAGNFPQVLKLCGIDYKSDYAGYAHNTLTTRTQLKNQYLDVDGEFSPDFLTFDPHDLWHARLHNILPVSIINKPVDEGTAYLYGGSWGISWKDILTKFISYAKNNPGSDWLALYNESKNFGDNPSRPLKVDYMINALLARKIEKEKGISAVLELLSCGKKIPGNENYFTALNKITGIDKNHFNAIVNELIKM